MISEVVERRFLFKEEVGTQTCAEPVEVSAFPTKAWTTNEPICGSQQGVNTCMSSFKCRCEESFSRPRINPTTKQSIQIPHVRSE
jgi:hypothetical protein